jgi:hypothetical protein
MSVLKHTDYQQGVQGNQRDLMQAIARIRNGLQHLIDGRKPELLSWIVPPTLEQLSDIFGLSPFEQDVLLLCAGMELDGNWETLCIQAQGNAQRNYPTLSLALAASPQPNWQALTPTAALRRWRLIQIGAGNALTTSPIRIDERILHYLVGVSHLDERLLGMVEAVKITEDLVPSHQQIVEQVMATWLQTSEGQFPVVQLCGEDVGSKRAIASMACQQMGSSLYVLSAQALPTDSAQLNLIQILCDREWLLSQTILLLDCEEVEATEPESAIARFIESLHAPLIITSRERRRQRQRPMISFDVGHPTTDEQRVIWANTLGEMASSLNGQVETIVSHFNLSAAAIRSSGWKMRAVCEQGSGGVGEQGSRGAGEQGSRGEDLIHNPLWDICRTQARPRLDELAQRIDSVSSWDDLILPEKECSILRDIAAHVRQRTKVYETWGFAGKSKRGLGISALFAGASGTGKTMAAEVLANELRLDVYRIDLSSVVSKYIGETEKNLRRLFDAAEGGGVILLFDEADALFGKRSEVKDSHDRHANIEVSYLLQRMESYRGLAILTTNLKGSLDQAFLRRIRFVVQFAFPDASQREEIWRRIFPAQTPKQGLDFKKLAKLNVAGGNIRNIALNAAFLAADGGESVEMKYILQAAKNEYVKMERPLTDVEVKGWV